ncbi:MAG: hypothetical protein IIX58_02465, partial [Alistipes sp.]|nr:hypothetical protein [Alistipes sp.]
LEYTYAGTEPGRWNVATVDFTLAAGTDKLYIKFEAKVASVYRLDDVKFYVGNGGQTVDLDNIEAPQPSEATKVTVAEFLNAAEDSTIYELTGKITNVTNTTYGNFYINDGTGEVLIYGLCSPTGEQKYWAESGAKVGDTITVQTVRTSYNGTPQGKNAIFVSLVPGEGGEEPTPEPAEGPYASDVAFVCATDDSTNAAYSLGTTTINGQAVTGFKLGKSKQAGKFTSAAVGVSGDKYLNFYAQGWKGGDVTLYFRVDGGATMSQKLASHDGVTGNPPYVSLAFADTDHYSFKLEGLTASSTIEFSTDANFALTSADSTMATARAIVCGVKLTDEALAPGEGGGNEGGNENPTPEPEPEPTPGDTITIASVLALGQGATINGTIEAVVVSNYELNNLTSKKGMYVQDETGALQFYLTANHEYAFGTKLQIDLTNATLGSYNGAVQVSGLGLDKITVVSTGNTVAPKTVTMADFLANKYEGQYIALEGVQVADADLSKTWVMGGAHTSINIEDANGNKFVVFSSKYATYGTSTVAQGSGVIKGISSINNGNMQIIFAQNSDYAGLTGGRFGEGGGEEPTPEPEPTPGDYAGRDDFNSIDWNSSYIARESAAGWVGENCAVQAGGPADANPVFPSLLGSSTDARAWVINGKTSAVGKITSPVITTGCGTLTFNYGMTFTEKNGYDFNVDIVQNGEVVKTFNVVNADNTKFGKYTFEEEVNVAGEFQIVITNNCPSASTSNKDRYSIWDVMWTAHN